MCIMAAMMSADTGRLVGIMDVHLSDYSHWHQYIEYVSCLSTTTVCVCVDVMPVSEELSTLTWYTAHYKLLLDTIFVFYYKSN